MFSSTQRWSSPTIDFSALDANQRHRLEVDVIQPAIVALELEILGSYLASCYLKGVNLPENSIKNGNIPDGWTDFIRFKSHGKCETGLLLERVLPCIASGSEKGIHVVANPEYNKTGTIIFAHDKPLNGYETKVRKEQGDRVDLEVKVTVRDESLFQAGWFRLQ